MGGKSDLMALLVVLGFGGVVIWFLTRDKGAAVNTNLVANPQTCGNGAQIGATVGTAIANYYGAVGTKVDCRQVGFADDPAGSTQVIADWANNWVDKSWEVTKHGVTAILPESLQFGSSKVCRCQANNKDVFPNDMDMCKHYYGITNCEDCGRKFDLGSMKWPWQQGYKQQSGAALPATVASPAPAAWGSPPAESIYFG